MSIINPVLSIVYRPNSQEYSIGDIINNMRIIDITDTDIILTGKKGEIFTYSKETGICLSDSKRKLPGLSDLPREINIINEVNRDDQLGMSLSYKKFFDFLIEIEFLRKILKEASKKYPDNLVKIIIQDSSGTHKKILLKAPFIKIDRYGRYLDLYSVGHYYIRYEKNSEVFTEAHMSNGRLTSYETHSITTIKCAYSKFDVSLTIDIPTKEELEDYKMNEYRV